MKVKEEKTKRKKLLGEAVVKKNYTIVLKINYIEKYNNEKKKKEV